MEAFLSFPATVVAISFFSLFVSSKSAFPEGLHHLPPPFFFVDSFPSPVRALLSLFSYPQDERQLFFPWWFFPLFTD